MFVAAVVFMTSAPLMAAEPASTDAAGDIAELIAELGNDAFAKREAAERSLVKIGNAALKQLHEAATSHKDPEIKFRAGRAIRRIDPNGQFKPPGIVAPKPVPHGLPRPLRPVPIRPIVPRPAPRVRIKSPFSRLDHIDVTRWGQDIANPFTNLKKESARLFKAKGIDIEKLKKHKAVLLTGSWCGANSKTFVNGDADTVLVLGKGFITHGKVISKGPVLAIENAHIMGSLQGEGLVWFVEKSYPRNKTTGKPLIAGLNTSKPRRDVEQGLTRGDFGWQRPDNFLKLPVTKKVDGKGAKLAVADARKKKEQLVAYIKAVEGTDVTKACKPTKNPFAALSKEGAARLSARGIDPKRLAKLKARYLTGSYCGANSLNFVNRDPNTVLVVGKGFVSHGKVFSLGPIVAVDDAHFMGDVTGADLVWFVDKSFPRDLTVGLPVILATTASHSQIDVATADVWWGDYGFGKLAVGTKKIQGK